MHPISDIKSTASKIQLDIMAYKRAVDKASRNLAVLEGIGCFKQICFKAILICDIGDSYFDM